MGPNDNITAWDSIGFEPHDHIINWLKAQNIHEREMITALFIQVGFELLNKILKNQQELIKIIGGMENDK